MPQPRYKKTFWVILWMVLTVMLIGGGSIIGYIVRFSGTDERVCGQCHPELVDLWRESKGHPAEQTKCHHCHARAHRFLPEEWNLIKHARDQLVPPEYLADDDLTSQRCLDCHPDVLDLGYIIKKKTLRFNHRVHCDESLMCVDCHRTAGHEYLLDSTNRPGISECLDCHRKEFEGPPKNQKCLNCHDVMLVPGKGLQIVFSSGLDFDLMDRKFE